MRELEVFFDYICPFCLRGHRDLLELLPACPDIEVRWRPYEVHPRPERYGLHSDLLIQGMLFAAACGADLLAYHERMYDAALRLRADIEDPHVVATLAAGLLDPGALEQALRGGQYRAEQQAGNDYAYTTCGVWAAPSYRLDGRALDSVENVGVSKAQLADFLRG